MFQLIARTIFPLALLASLAGCAAEDCPPIPDGYYQASPTTPGYTFVGGLPLAFAGWSYPDTEAACTTTYQCDGPDGQHETVTVTLVRRASSS